MANYSSVEYGTPGLKYGQLDNNRAYYNVGLRAWAYAYGSISLIWTAVLADPADPQPTHWKLIRNNDGASDSPYEGVIIDSGPISTFRLSAVDITADPGIQVTYSLWVFNGTSWINCGNSSAINVASTDTLAKIEKWIPAAWLNDGDSVGEPSTSDLTKVLSTYAFAYDKLRTEVDLLEKSVSYKYTPIEFLQAKVTQEKFNYEPTLGDLYHRSLYRGATNIYSEKGTPEGITSYIKALTHWTSETFLGSNILLDYNDSSFEESIGRWGITGGTLTHQHYATSLADIGTAVTAPTPTVYSAEFPARAIGFGYLKTTSTGALTITLPSIGSNPITKGVPVIPKTTYTFAAYMRRITSNGAVTIIVNWYDSSGTFISSTATPSPTTVNSSWVQVSSTPTAAPLTAAYATVTLTIAAGTANRYFLIDMCQFSTDISEYQDARKAIIYLYGENINYIPNPSFEPGVSGWSALNGTLTNSTTPAGAKIWGSKVAKLTVSSAGRAAIVTDWIHVDEGGNYVFSAFVSSNNPALKARARLEFSSMPAPDDQVKVLKDDDGYYYPNNFYYVDSDELLLTSTAERIYASAIAPNAAVDSTLPLAKCSIYIDDANAGDILYVDAALLQDAVLPTNYFDGGGSPMPEDPINSEVIDAADCAWEGTTNASRSHTWRNYAVKRARIAATLPMVLPLGSSWEFRVGSPTFYYYPELTPSVLEAPSFEESTNGWNTTNATLTRQETRGTLFDTIVTNGSAFGHVTSTASGVFGVYTDHADVDYTSGYYVSIAVKPENEDAAGDYTLTVRFYDDYNIQVTSKTVTSYIHRADRWAYMGVYAQKYEINGATYAVATVECDPDTPSAGLVFHLDRVVFRH